MADAKPRGVIPSASVLCQNVIKNPLIAGDCKPGGCDVQAIGLSWDSEATIDGRVGSSDQRPACLSVSVRADSLGILPGEWQSFRCPLDSSQAQQKLGQYVAAC